MSNNNSNSFLSFLIGTITGGLLGILFAPDNGKNTRDKLSFQLDKYRNKLDDLVEEFVEGKEMTADNQAKQAGEKIVNEAKEKAEQLLEDVNGLIERIQD